MRDLLARYRDFRLLFVAQVISNGGDWFATVAALGLVSDATDKAGWAAALVFLSQTLPGFFGALIGGPIADRRDRRSVMVTCAAIQCGAAGLFVVAATVGPWWLVYFAQGGISFMASVFGPASNAAVPNLVEERDLKTAAAMVGATWGAMLAIGAVLGAGFTAVFGRTASFVADAATFVIAAVLILAIRTPLNRVAPGAEAGDGAGAGAGASASASKLRPLKDVSEALRYARRDPPTLALLGSKFAFGFTSGVAGMLAVLATKRYGTGDWGPGFLLGARGVGVVAGPLLFQRLAGDGLGRMIRACGIATLVYGCCYLGVAASPTIFVAAPLVLAAHLGGGAQWTISTYGLQSRTPDALRGRVMAGDFALVTLSMSASFLLSGLAETAFGVVTTIALLAAAALAVGSVYLVLTGRLDVGDEPPAPRDAEPELQPASTTDRSNGVGDVDASLAQPTGTDRRSQ